MKSCELQSPLGESDSKEVNKQIYKNQSLTNNRNKIINFPLLMISVKFQWPDCSPLRGKSTESLDSLRKSSS